MEQLAAELRHIVANFIERLNTIPAREFAHKPAPNKWSKIELLGHLVDSAQNNLRRFIVTQYESAPPHITYDQDFWVKANSYQTLDKDQVILLWKLMNERICVVFQNTPESALGKECNTGKQEPSLHTIEWLAHDYMKHLKYHLNQIVPGSTDVLTYP